MVLKTNKLKKYLSLTFSALFIAALFSAFTSSDKASDKSNKNDKDVDVMEMAKDLGIRTEVDETQYSSHPGIKVKITDNESDIKVNFFNLNFKRYKLSIYDVNGLAIGHYEDFEDARASIDTRLLDAGVFLYKVSGEGNIFAGKFELK
ncbi:MAG: hypothetical protein WD334_11515 [Chitinophagales bacterium]